MTDRAAHLYAGGCPDDLQPDSFDPECPACQNIRSRGAGPQAATQEREAFVAILDKWSTASHLTLHAGEMTAQELRTVRAVVAGIKADIRGAGA